VWQKVSPGIIIDCVEMDPETQERALLDGRIAVGILVLGDRPILELLRVQLLMEHPVTVALPKSHPQQPCRRSVCQFSKSNLSLA